MVSGERLVLLLNFQYHLSEVGQIPTSSQLLPKEKLVDKENQFCLEMTPCYFPLNHQHYWMNFKISQQGK